MPISAENLASGRGEVTFEFQGETCTVTYRADKITKQFRAESLHLEREAKRVQVRQKLLMLQIQKVEAQAGTPEADAEDASAEQAIAQLLKDDEEIKRGIDRLVCTVVEAWDVYQKDGSMMPITMESLFPINAVFESQLLSAVVEHASLGEASASSSLRTSPSHSKPEELLAIGPQSQNSTITSKQANGAQQ